MNVDNDKILFDALHRVLQDQQYGYIGEAFMHNSEDLQRMLPALTKWQQHTLECYVHSLADVYVAALAIALEEKPKES